MTSVFDIVSFLGLGCMCQYMQPDCPVMGEPETESPPVTLQFMSDPQQYTPPSLPVAHVCSPPTLTEVTVTPVGMAINSGAGIPLTPLLHGL